MIDDLLPWADSLNSEKVGILQFYFAYEDFTIQTAEDVVRSLLRQLVCLLDRLPIGLEDTYDFLIERGRSPDNKELVDLLHGCLRESFHVVYIFLDGLDECREKERFSVLELISGFPKPVVRLFLTTRTHLLADPAIRAHK